MNGFASQTIVICALILGGGYLFVNHHECAGGFLIGLSLFVG